MSVCLHDDLYVLHIYPSSPPSSSPSPYYPPPHYPLTPSPGYHFTPSPTHFLTLYPVTLLPLTPTPLPLPLYPYPFTPSPHHPSSFILYSLLLRRCLSAIDCHRLLLPSQAHIPLSSLHGIPLL